MSNISDWHVGLYVAAVLIPLAAFAVQAIFIRQLKRYNAYIATGAIMLSCFLSLVGFGELLPAMAPWGEADGRPRRSGGGPRRGRGARSPASPACR